MILVGSFDFESTSMCEWWCDGFSGECLTLDKNVCKPFLTTKFEGNFNGWNESDW